MNLLLVGSGGREHALAWKLAQSPRLGRLWVAPGNGGTGENVAISAHDVTGLLEFASRNAVDLTVVGPELPLSLGLVDQLHERGQAVFGPTCAAARLETSKSFAKAFMIRYGIPTARYSAFTEFAAELN